MQTNRRYKFSWDLIGNIAEGRPNLGNTTRLEVYRLMQFAFRDVIEQNFGTKKTDALFYQAGKLAGVEFYHHYIGDMSDFQELIRRLQKVLRELNVGILRVEKADVEKGSYVFTLAEDLDCSGLPNLEYELCTFDEGFLAGIMELFTGNEFIVKEIDCWCTGDRTCRYTADVVENKIKVIG